MGKIGDIIRGKIQGIQTVMRTAPGAIGAIAVEHFKDNFNKGGFVNKGLKKWPNRKGNKDPGRAILVKRARLKNGIRIFRADQNQVTVGNSLPYARIHNEGGTITQYARSELFMRNRKQKGVRKGQFSKGTKPAKGFTYGKRTIRIPKRQYMGDSFELRGKISKWYIDSLRKHFVIK